MNKIYLFTILTIFATNFYSQNTSNDSIKRFNNLVQQLPQTKNDTLRLNLLFDIHYCQQALLGDLTEANINKFDDKFTKEAIRLATSLKKFDTLKSLTVDIGFIFDLRKEYDSSFFYYNNCLSAFEEANKYELTYAITQNIFYNNSLLQGIIKENNIRERAQTQKINLLTKIGLGVLILFIAFLIYFFLRSHKQNKNLRYQKDLIQKSKTEIESSINYAENIQHSVLSNENKLKALFPNSFVLFMPRDKVSGDFMWTNQLDNFVYVAVADCTGHGVPGALLSIVGHFMLDAVLIDGKNKVPSEILNNLHESIVKSLDQHNSNKKGNHDGMDIGFLKFDLKNNKLFYAGAHRSLYHLRDKVVSEFKGTRRPIGGTQIAYKKPFIDYELDFNQGDLVYCYSDGFQDQIGGEENKKFMNKNLINLILENSEKNLEFQKNELKEKFIKFKGTNNQIDDVLIVGIKL